MGKSYFDFGHLLKKKDKKKEDPQLDSLGLMPMKIKTWSNTITIKDQPRQGLTATQQMMSSNFLMQQSLAAANMQAEQQAQMAASPMDLATVEAQTKMLQQMMQQQPLMEVAPYVMIQDCHCKNGCWDCDDRRVMAIPTVEWDLNR